jgi:hypothetical protein
MNRVVSSALVMLVALGSVVIDTRRPSEGVRAPRLTSIGSGGDVFYDDDVGRYYGYASRSACWPCTDRTDGCMCEVFDAKPLASILTLPTVPVLDPNTTYEFRYDDGAVR